MIWIVIPAYNAACFLRATLDSVLCQTWTDWEAIVVDDGSTDDTCRIAEEFGALDQRIRLVKQPNAGPSAARNRGAAMADPRATAFIFLDADDTWEPNALEVLQGELERRPEAVGAYGVAVAADSNGKLLGSNVYEQHQRRRHKVAGNTIVPVAAEETTTFECEIVTEMIVTCGTVLMRRDAFVKTAGWPEDIRLWEDWEFWLRLTRLGGLAFVDVPVLVKKERNDSLSSNWAEVEAGERIVRERLLKSLAFDSELRASALLGAAFHHRRIIADKIAWIKNAASSGDILSAMKQARHVIRLWMLGPVR